MKPKLYEGPPLFDEDTEPTPRALPKEPAEAAEAPVRTFDEYVALFRQAIDERLVRDIEDYDPPENAIPHAVSTEPFSGEYLQIQVLQELGYRVRLMGWLEELTGDSPESDNVSLSVDEPDQSAVESIRSYSNAPAFSHPRGLDPPYRPLLHGGCDTYMHADTFDPDNASYGEARQTMYASGHDPEQTEKLLSRMFMTATILNEIRDSWWPEESSRHHPDDLPLYAYFHSRGVRPLEISDLYDMEMTFTTQLLADNPQVPPPTSHRR